MAIGAVVGGRGNGGQRIARGRLRAGICVPCLRRADLLDPTPFLEQWTVRLAR